MAPGEVPEVLHGFGSLAPSTELLGSPATTPALDADSLGREARTEQAEVFPLSP